MLGREVLIQIYIYDLPHNVNKQNAKQSANQWRICGLKIACYANGLVSPNTLAFSTLFPAHDMVLFLMLSS